MIISTKNAKVEMARPEVCQNPMLLAGLGHQLGVLFAANVGYRKSELAPTQQRRVSFQTTQARYEQ